MTKQLKSIYARTAPTLIEDALGAGALVVLLIAALHFPGLN